MTGGAPWGAAGDQATVCGADPRPIEEFENVNTNETGKG